MRSSETHRDWSKNGQGCIFDHFGKVPEVVYQPTVFESPLEEAVHKNDLQMFHKLVEEGCVVCVGLKVGEMSCVEYAAMMGYSDMLMALLQNSRNVTTLKKYFALDDIVERAYMISRNKSLFFEKGALAEANRYEAALYTAIEYNQPVCVKILVSCLGTKEPGRHNFYVNDNQSLNLSATELAEARGHTQCYELMVENMSPRQ